MANNKVEEQIINNSKRTIDDLIISRLDNLGINIRDIREHDIRDLRAENRELNQNIKLMCDSCADTRVKVSEDLGWIKAKLENNKAGKINWIFNIISKIFRGGV